MSSKAAPPRQVPTLTEIVQFAEISAAPTVAETPAPPPLAPSAAAPAKRGFRHSALPPGAEEQITQRILAELQRKIDLTLEYRLRETLAPAVARMADQLVRDTRAELASTLRDVISKAVAQELEHLRRRP